MPSHTVLIVDDSSVDLEIISIVCKLLGCEADVVSDGFDAINLYNPERHELVLCDYVMEPVNGIYVISKIKEMHPQAKCIMVSGFPDAQLRRFVEENHLYDLVVKPIQAETLRQILRLALDGGEGATEEIKGIALSNRMDACTALCGESEQMRKLRDQLAARIGSDRPLLLVSEPGGGKGEIADFVHQNGPRAGGTCVVCDCAKHSEKELATYLIDESGDLGVQIRRAEKGTLILHGVEKLPLVIQQRMAAAFDPITKSTRLILLADAPLEEGLEQGSVDDGFYFKFGSDVLEVPSA